MSRGFTTDGRAVAFTTEYALTVLVAVGLLAAVPAAFATVSDSAQEDVVQAEFDRIAGEVAASVDAVDHQHAQHQTATGSTGISGVTPQAAVRPDIPRQVGETAYLIRIINGTVIVEPPGPGGPDAQGTAPLPTELNVTANGGTPGGAVIVELDPSTDTIQIKVDANSGELPTEVGGDA